MSFLKRINPFAKKELILTDPIGWGFGGSTLAGVSIDDNTALQITASWQAIRLISETLGSMPLHLYRKTDNGREKVTTHRLSKLIKHMPNRYMTAVEFKEGVAVDLLCHGHAYAKIVALGGGQVFSILPIPKNCVTPRILKYPDPSIPGSIKGDLIYRVNEEGLVKDYKQDEILSIKGFGGVGKLEGYAPHKMHRQALGVSLAAENYAGNYFGNGASSGGFIENEHKLDPEQLKKWQENYAENHSDPKTAFRYVMLERGMKFIQRSVSNSDNQMLETRKHQIAEVARIYNVPLSMLMEMDRATWGNTEQQSLNFVKYTLNPYTTRIEAGLNASLLTDREFEDGYYFEYDLRGLLRGDLAARSAFYKDMRISGAMTQNEIREKENLPRKEGGDDLHVPLNMAPTDLLRDILEPETATRGKE